MTNDKAILDLMADLYRQVTALQAENQQLRAQLAQANQPHDQPSP